jgi:two-component system chemotaxis response regulator CheY
MRVLIVDDSRFTREYLRQMLQALSMTCAEAENGVEGLNRLGQGEPFDLMLCDINMPVMDGLQCLKVLRESGLHPAMKVMMVTTEADDPYIIEALRHGADEFLMKPFTAQCLREKLLLMGIAA